MGRDGFGRGAQIAWLVMEMETVSGRCFANTRGIQPKKKTKKKRKKKFYRFRRSLGGSGNKVFYVFVLRFNRMEWNGMAWHYSDADIQTNGPLPNNPYLLASSSASVELYISSEAKLDWYDMKHKQNECGHFLCDVQVYEMMIYMCSERIYVEHAIDVDASVGVCGNPISVSLFVCLPPIAQSGSIYL